MTLSATCTAKIWAGPSQTTLSVRPRMEMTVLFAGIPISDDGKPSAECLTPAGSRDDQHLAEIRRVPRVGRAGTMGFNEQRRGRRQI